jgi:hypothetical protein
MPWNCDGSAGSFQECTVGSSFQAVGCWPSLTPAIWTGCGNSIVIECKILTAEGGDLNKSAIPLLAPGSGVIVRSGLFSCARAVRPPATNPHTQSVSISRLPFSASGCLFSAELTASAIH